MATTVTATSTFIRLELIKLQFGIALERTTDITKETLERFFLGIDRQWVRKLTISGLTEEKLCRAQLSLEIDWNEYELQMALERTTVALDEKCVDNTTLELSQALRLFNEFVNLHQLTTIWHFQYIPQIYDNAELLATALETMNMVTASPVQWIDTYQEVQMTLYELPEISIGLSVV
jgi:hypothetical protein